MSRAQTAAWYHVSVVLVPSLSRGFALNSYLLISVINAISVSVFLMSGGIESCRVCSVIQMMMSSQHCGACAVFHLERYMISLVIFFKIGTLAVL